MGKPPTSQPPGRRTAITMGDPRGIGPEVMPQAVQAVLAGTSPESLLLLGPDGSDPGLVPFEGVGPWDGTEAGAGRRIIRTRGLFCGPRSYALSRPDPE